MEVDLLEAVPFWSSPYPFNDFLVFSFCNSEFNEDRIDIALNKMRENNFSEANRKSNDNITTICFSQLIFENDNKENVVVFSGVSQSNGQFYYGQNSLKNQINNRSFDDEEFFNSLGIYTVIRKNKNDIIISQDPLGCGTIFYIQTENFILSSNRYHILLLFLSWIGVKGTLRTEKIVSTLYSNTTFLSTNISRRMDIEGVYQLEFTKEIVISENGWRISENEVVNSFFENNCDDTELLIEKAKEEIILNIKSIINSSQFSQIVTDLSGGVDSRLVFAAILNIEDGLKNIDILNKDVPGSRDLEISIGLKEMFGGKYSSEIGTIQYPVPLEENLNIWRSYFMGTYYKMGNSAWSTRGERNNKMRLSGGTGEIYRVFWNKIYNKNSYNPNSTKEMSEFIVNLFTKIDPFVQDKYRLMLIDIIDEEISLLPGSDTIEKFENHYFFYRNRYHFGMRAFDYYHDGPVWFPLMSKSLLNLVNQIGFQERKNGSVMMELTEKLHPLLIWIDYDSMSVKENEYITKKLYRDPRFKGIKLNLMENRTEWDENNIINKEILIKSRPKMNDSFNLEWRYFNIKIKEDLFQTLHYLRNYNEIFNDLISETFIDNINKNSSNLRFIAELYSKASSLKDQIDIFS